MRIRRYKESDLEQMLKLLYDTVHNVNIKDYSPEQVDVWAPKEPEVEKWSGFFENNICYVAEIDDKIVGFGDLTAKGYLNTLYTHKDFQRKGIGSGLLKVFEKEAINLGVSEITTEASITARPFFEKHGFECVKKQNKEFKGMVFINFLMRKSL
ncbi:putative acetyltransferase [Thermosediminibacter litoriperuensis]|uniref:Putative acetyltransferase n=2 Tax=Thermosediminibacter litoriperuensis TaxID=291989 RepID=A0A5S5AFQ1_9FIRM|nr:GNAT family N-acetyltransferase [Thermosediminibacter litoriperuensis]TYP48148.1 putative acetyltransferase [Thermosediminibacter litoriperuensis]